MQLRNALLSCVIFSALLQPSPVSLLFSFYCRPPSSCHAVLSRPPAPPLPFNAPPRASIKLRSEVTAALLVLPPRVWEVTTGEVLNTLIHHNEAVLHLRFANGLMVTCSKDRSIAVWDMASPTDISLRRVLVGHRAAVNVVDFDDKYIVSASGDRTIKVTAVIQSPQFRLVFFRKSRRLIKGRLVAMGVSCSAPPECSLSGTRTFQTFHNRGSVLRSVFGKPLFKFYFFSHNFSRILPRKIF